MASGKLGRSATHRRAMFRNLVTSLLEHERIQTTDAKAKQVRRIAERMITLGKRGHLQARRRALRVVRTKAVAAKLFSDLADRYRDRAGGYTRVVKVGPRSGDAAPLSIVELVKGKETAPGKGRRKGSETSAKPEEKGRRRSRRPRAEGAEEEKASPARRLGRRAAGSAKSGKKSS
jgi:large subunit ribosomal protein L17